MEDGSHSPGESGGQDNHSIVPFPQGDGGEGFEIRRPGGRPAERRAETSLGETSGDQQGQAQHPPASQGTVSPLQPQPYTFNLERLPLYYGTLIPSPKTRSQKPEIRNQKP